MQQTGDVFVSSFDGVRANQVAIEFWAGSSWRQGQATNRFCKIAVLGLVDEIPATFVPPVEDTTPTETVTPVEPVTPVVPVTPVEPVTPVVPVTPVEPVNPVVPVTPVEPAVTPTEPENTNPSEGGFITPSDDTTASNEGATESNNQQPTDDATAPSD